MTFRQAEEKDCEQVMQIIKQAQDYFKENGIDQWQNGYPNNETIKQDISNQKTYVFIKDDKILATAALSFNDEKTYERIYEGEWLSKASYGVVHRVAVNNENKGMGIGMQLFQLVEEICKEKGAKSIKIDTHQDNKSMQKLLEKLGFRYCGIIYLIDGNQRIAYEKLL